MVELGQETVADASESHRFPCPACGANLRYLPGTSLLGCQHCGHEEPIPDLRGAIAELDLRAVETQAVPASEIGEARFARCSNCGAQIEFDADLHALACPFCASPIVVDTGVRRLIKPQAQLPFVIDEDEARSALRRWLGRLWFAPSNLRQYARANRAMQGVYVPYWTYDAETETAYSGQRGIVYHETKSVPVIVNGRRQMATQQVARVRWSPASGRVARDFDDVLVLGSGSLPKHLTDALAPWDLSALSAYDPRYLAGFLAEGYGIPVEDGYREAREIMNAVIAGDVRRDIGGDQQRIGRLDTNVGRLTFKHVLLPVWLAAYKYRGKSFRFVVNGRTGAIEGERPYSGLKIALAVLAMLLLAMAIAWLQVGQDF